MRSRGFVAQEFLDGVRDERAVLEDLSALVGVLGQYLAHPAEQPTGRLHAGAGDHGDEREDLVGQPADRAREVLELDVAARR